MRTTPETIAQEFKENFGEQLTGKQLWTLVKFAKYVRLRARNNTAFNNFCNRVFHPNAVFTAVTKRRMDGTTHPGLQITVKGEATVELHDEGEE